MVHPTGGKQIFDCYGGEVVKLLISSGLNTDLSAKNLLTALQAFSNLFCVKNNLFKEVLLACVDEVLDIVTNICAFSKQISLKPSATALVTLLLKYVHNNAENWINPYLHLNNIIC